MKYYIVAIEVGDLRVYVTFSTGVLYLPRAIESLFFTSFRGKSGNIEQLVNGCLDQIDCQLVRLVSTVDTLVISDDVIVKVSTRDV